VERRKGEIKIMRRYRKRENLKRKRRRGKNVEELGLRTEKGIEK
jgi:hypothetical protein